MQPKNAIFIFILFYLLQSVQLFSQNNHVPVRIVEKIELVKEVSSKYGVQERKRSKIVVVYNDSAVEVMTHHKLNALIATIPEAQAEWKKYNRNRVYEASSIPLFALGFWGTYNLLKGEHPSRNALIGIVGLSGGYLTFEHFDWQKKRNLKKIMSICNNVWSHSGEQNDLKDLIKPDVIRLGVINESTIGVGLTWQISK